jgi:amino acid transporter
MLVQGGAAAILLIVSQIGGADATSAYQLLVDATNVMYFIAFVYMFLSVIRLRKRPDRGTQPGHALIPLGRFGLWACGVLGLVITLLAIAISLIPPQDLQGSPVAFEIKLVGICAVLILTGLVLYWRKNKRGPVSA